MFTIALAFLGWLGFIVVSLACGAWLRRNPSKKAAETSSRTVQFVFWIGLVLPGGNRDLLPGTHSLR
jgi:hypothetical protein